MSFEGDPLAFYGRGIIEEYDTSLRAKLPRDDTIQRISLDISNDALRSSSGEKVGILGAGVGGLYTALILESLGIEFEILEASDRVGGRLLTYRFSEGNDYDYYDAGAMRYPLPKMENGEYKNGIMKRLGQLIIYDRLNEGKEPLQKKLIPYYMKARDPSNQAFYYFNGVRERISDTPGSFCAEKLGVPTRYIKAGTDAIRTDVVTPFAMMLVEDIKQGKREEGWRVMMANDSYSIRAYMSSKYIPSVNLALPPEHLPGEVINWCELMETSTKAYDRALTEEVFESLAFASIGGTDFSDVDWMCFDGGSEVLTTRMAEVITERGGQIHFDKTVTTISQGQNAVQISVNSGEELHVYSHVISTLPLPVLRTIDMTRAGVNVKQKNALRQLQYGPSIKIAIRFDKPWWTTELGIVGGQSFTDLPIRTIVYPSYGDKSCTPSTVLIASYTWTTDAERLGALAKLDKTDVLKELVLRNLAEVHGPPITYERLQQKFRDMHVMDWTYDAHTMGAFAQFGPGDFAGLYTSLTYPAADRRLHFAGEAISTRHAWVVGALDSAWRAVYEYLCVTEQEDKMATFLKLWGRNVEWTKSNDEKESPLVSLPGEHLSLVHGAILAGDIGF
ncbi:amine oxidase [Pisolithus marmoratus]|nr:amine oxidase [Pisolithus marmoratus]